MAKTKAELLKEAKQHKLDVSEKNTVAEITEALKKAIADQASTEQTNDDVPSVDNKTTKAGKRSAKAQREKVAEEAKEVRKQSAQEAAEQPKPAKKPTRSRFERRAKGYRAVAERIEKQKIYPLLEAIDLAIATSRVKFDATVEAHIRLNVDPRQADQNIRDSVVLPAGTGKTKRVAVFADVDDAEKAKKAGADMAQGDELLEAFDKGRFDFDVLIATPAMMPKLGKYARSLGPKGLMPNPKSGTVTKDVAKAVKEAKSGKIEYRVDESGIIHAPIGKVSFGADKITSNAKALFASVKSNKPATIKSSYVLSIHATTSMGPSIPVQASELA